MLILRTPSISVLVQDGKIYPFEKLDQILQHLKDGQEYTYITVSKSLTLEQIMKHSEVKKCLKK